MLVPWNQEDILERSKLRNIALGLKPDEGGFCVLETGHDRKTSPTLKLFVPTMWLQEPRKTVLGSGPGEDFFL
jgi:hypothetical protein